MFNLCKIILNDQFSVGKKINLLHNRTGDGTWQDWITKHPSPLIITKKSQERLQFIYS